VTDFFDYDEAKADADELIEEFGQAGKLRVPKSSGPPHKPTPLPPDEHDAIFAVLEYEAKDIDGTRILATDKYVILAVGTLPVEPATSHLLVEASGKTLKIIALAPLEPAGVAVFYGVQARR
jgi:hypothetical protein